MPSSEWLKIKEGKTSGNPKQFQEFQIISHLFHKKECMAIQVLLCRCQEDFRMGYAGCGFDHCKTAKTRVGQFLAI